MHGRGQNERRPTADIVCYMSACRPAKALCSIATASPERTAACAGVTAAAIPGQHLADDDPSQGTAANTVR